MHEFPEHLARLGHEVGFVQFPEGLSSGEIRALGKRKRIPGRVVEGAAITLFTPWTISGSLLGRLFTAASSYWQFRKILMIFEPDVVVSFSVPTSGWQALLACKRLRVPFVFRALDVSHKIRKGPFAGLVKGAERFIYRNADAISANNGSMAQYCITLGGAENLTAVHDPPLDLALFEKGDRETARKRLGLGSGDHLTIYLGSFFYFSGLEAVITEWKTQASTGYLVLVGGGEQDEQLRSLVLRLGLEKKVLFTGMLPFKELPDLLAGADLALNPMEKSLVSDTALPNKVLQYLAAGLPVASTSLDGLMTTFSNTSNIFWLESPVEVGRFAAKQAGNKTLKRTNYGTALRKMFGSESVVAFEEFLSSTSRQR
jgi:glycosyltransferase involved in cell wall biosynthesis